MERIEGERVTLRHVYEKLGFRQVGVTRLSERGADGSWHDELLMEYVVEPSG